MQGQPTDAEETAIFELISPSDRNKIKIDKKAKCKIQAVKNNNQLSWYCVAWAKLVNSLTRPSTIEIEVPPSTIVTYYRTTVSASLLKAPDQVDDFGPFGILGRSRDAWINAILNIEGFGPVSQLIMVPSNAEYPTTSEQRGLLFLTLSSTFVRNIGPIVFMATQVPVTFGRGRYKERQINESKIRADIEEQFGTSLYEAAIRRRGVLLSYITTFGLEDDTGAGTWLLDVRIVAIDKNKS